MGISKTNYYKTKNTNAINNYNHKYNVVLVRFILTLILLTIH